MRDTTPEANPYRYSAEPTRNPFRYLGAVWRFVRTDLDELDVRDAAIVQMGFNRSRIGRRIARWEEAVAHLRSRTGPAEALDARRRFPPVVLGVLEQLPEGTLGRVFANHCRREGIDPNLVQIPADDEVGWFLDHLYKTHDIWHVLTGWGTDVPGEVGVAGFYCGQLGSPPFFSYNLALILLNVTWRRGDVGQIFEAFSVGLQSGKRAGPLFGTPWDELWETPIAELRERFDLAPLETVGRGVRGPRCSRLAANASSRRHPSKTGVR